MRCVCLEQGRAEQINREDVTEVIETGQEQVTSAGQILERSLSGPFKKFSTLRL